jgi:O-antigen/teichoic acid export membrane protein
MRRSHLVARNVFVTLVTQLLLWALTFAVTLFLPKYLKDTGLGTITLVGSYATIFSVLIGLGTSTVLIKEIARNGARTGELVLASLVARFVLGIAIIAIGWLGMYLLRYSPIMQLFAVIALIIMVVGQLNDVLSNALAGLEEFPKQNASLLVERVITACLTIGLVILRQPLWMFIAVGIIGAIISTCFSGYTLRKYFAAAPRPQWATISSLFRAGMPFLMVGIFAAIYQQSDALLLSKISGVAAIGWYSLARRLGGSTMVIPVALTGTMLPTLSRLHVEDRSAFNVAVRRLLNLMVICVIPFSAVLMLAPGQILSLLHYPAAYRHSIPVLMLVGSTLILWYLSQAVGTALVASDRQAIFGRITGIAAVVSIPLCAICIFATQHIMSNGAVGAMLSDMLLELLMVIAYIRALPEGVFEWGVFSVFGRAIVAALPFVLSLYVMGNSRNLAWPILGLILYPVVCYLLRCLNPDDLLILRQLTRKFSRA